MIDKTEIETQAIQAARKNLWETFVELGLAGTFQNAPPEVYDRIIEACVDGFQEYVSNLEAPF